MMVLQRQAGVMSATVLGLSALAFGQWVGPAVRVNSPNERGIMYRETAIAVSPANPLHIVAAVIQDHPLPPAFKTVEYGVSVNGGMTFTTGEFHPGPGTCLTNTVHADPMVAASTSGELWLGALVYNPSFGANGLSGVYVSRIAPSSPTLGPLVIAHCNQSFPHLDKPLMAAGPLAHGLTQRLFVAWYNGVGTGCGGVHSWGLRSLDTTGDTWPSAPVRIEPNPPGSSPCRFMGSGHAPVILPSGVNTGRAVVAYMNGDPTDSDPGEAIANALPRVVHSTTSMPELLWNPSIARINYPVGSPDRIFAVDDTAIPGTFGVASYPGIAFDPTNPSVVYVIFAGQRGSKTNGNHDLYIGRSNDGGVTFESSRILRLSDFLLSAPEGSDQFMPWVAVDEYGGVNILYYQTRTDPPYTEANPGVDAYYAHIPSYSASISQPIYRVRLTPTSFTFNVPPLPNVQSLGEYQMVCATGCYAYVCYVSTHEGAYNYYVRQILVNAACVVDFNQDSDLNALDMQAFLNGYADQDPRADIDANGVFSASDVAEFVNAYNSQVLP